MIRDDDGKLDVKAIHLAYRESYDATAEWREESEGLLEKVAGHQWSEEDLAAMAEQERPAVTFNRMEVLVNAVCGLEVINREEVRYLPRRPGPVNTQVADMKTSAAHYICSEGDAEAEISSAFRDLSTIGMGWLDTAMDYDADPDGEVAFAKLNPLWQFWDARARKRNLKDSKWILRLKPFSRAEFEERWPDAEVSYSNIFEPPEAWSEVHDATEAWRYEGDGPGQDLPKDNVWVAHVQWYEPKTSYRVHGLNGQTKEFPAAVWRKFEKQYPQHGLQAVRVKRRQYWHAYICGETVLEETEHDCDGFTQICMTGKPDANRGCWYGLGRNLEDPQDWLNVLYSSILHVLRSGSKGGLLAETDAFENPRNAEADWASSTAITWLRSGALAAGKVQQKGNVPYPTGMDRLMTVASEMFPATTGMSLELLGLAERVQPGILEAQRKQAGMTILSWAFDSLRLFRKQHGRLLAEFVEHYLSDGRLVRITGKEGQQYVPLLKDPEVQNYDIITASAPSSVSEKEKVWAVLESVLPYLLKAGIPIPPEIMDYAPLPAPLAEAWKQLLSQPSPEQQQKAQMAEQLAVRRQQAEIAETESKAQLNLVKADVEKFDAQTDRMKVEE